MLKRKVAGVVIAGFLLGAGAAQAQSTFPFSVSDTGPNYVVPPGVAPAAAYGGSLIQARTSTFPNSVSDTGPNYPWTRSAG
jgi:hypothetical protein